jgi:hypothetical protein
MSAAPKDQTTDRPVLLLDAWMPDYEGAVQIDSVEQDGVSADVDPTVETAHWTAIRPTTPSSQVKSYFIDGVRRTEARVLAWDKGKMVHGLFGAVGAGAVRTDGRHATFDRCIIRRVLFLSSGYTHSEILPVGETSVSFEGIASVATSPAEIALDLQELMRHGEAGLAQDILDGDAIIFIDGPLAYISSSRPMVGVVKRIFLPYLEPARFALVGNLALAERTPLFAIRDGKNDRYSWYLRIAQGRAFDHALTGIIRLEVRAAVGVDVARKLAGVSAPLLTQFASSPMRDPRAPQNLVPIGALEQELRRRMGDPLLIRRAIEKRIWEGVQL